MIKSAFAIIMFGLVATAALAAEKKTVLVYTGMGSCTDGCSDAAAEIPALMGYNVKYVSAKQITPEIFEDAVLWIQPGGNAIKAAKFIGEARMVLLRSFVKKGGGYVGFCAGAFFADKTVDDDEKIPGLGIIPVGTWDYPVYSNEGWGTLVWVHWNNTSRQVFFNGGASFYIRPKTKNVEVLATYGEHGLPATIQSTYGKGKVVVTGFHPEATEVWKQGAMSKDTTLNDADGSDVDMARDMILRALPN